MSQLVSNIQATQARIEAAAQRAGRNPEQITLVAVTKTHPLETVTAAYQAGLRHFGENRAAEGNEKIAQFARWQQDQPAAGAAQWHFIGHIQTRQAGDVIGGQYDLIHSVDRLKLARRINRLASRDALAPVDVLLQCNVSGEESKSGFDLSNWNNNPKQVTAFLKAVADIEALEKLTIRGLMTMAPITDDPEAIRPVFRRLAALRKRLQEEMPHLDWQQLSMGMTDDFEVAIEEGATIVRIGRAIFGERTYT